MSAAAVFPIGTRDVLELHDVAVELGGGDAAVSPAARSRVDAALESALVVTHYLSGADPALVYAAAVLRNLATYRPFATGNVRAAWLCCAAALRRNGLDLRGDDDWAIALCRAVVRDRLDVDAIARRLADEIALA